MKTKNMNKILILLSSFLILGSCVSSKKYKDLQAEMDKEKMSLQKCNENLANCESEKSKMDAEHKDAISKMESDAKATQER
jgi:hypothetical protein